MISSTRWANLNDIDLFAESELIESGLLPARLLLEVELALGDSPRYYARFPPEQEPMHPDEYANEVGYDAPGPLISCKGLRQIFSTLPDQPRLVSLELVFQAAQDEPDATERAMYSQISAICPNVHILELHRYRKGESSTVPVAAILDSLFVFENLRQLRLNLDLTPVGHFPSYDYAGTSAFLADAAALVLPAVMPRLDRVSFLEKTPSNSRKWTTWVLRHTDIGVVAEKDWQLSSQGDISWI